MTKTQKTKRKVAQRKVFAERLQAARNRLSLSREQLAERMNTTPPVTYIHRWETPNQYGSMPDAGYIASLAQALSVSSDWLLGVTDEQPF